MVRAGKNKNCRFRSIFVPKSHSRIGNKKALRSFLMLNPMPARSATVKKRLSLGASLFTILQILSVTIFEKISLFQMLTVPGMTMKVPGHF
jgi:hypothetical protein